MRFTHSIHPHVNTFIVATAALMTVLALACPAKAEIVYHQTNIVINLGSYPLDLNGDGVTDFFIASVSGGVCEPFKPGHWGSLFESPAAGNGAVLGPLQQGAGIGPSRTFKYGTLTLAAFNEDWTSWKWPFCSWNWWGAWHTHPTGYLGLAFQLNGQTYYGWAELNVSGISAVLTGYAYETTPGMRILAGQTQ